MVLDILRGCVIYRRFHYYVQEAGEYADSSLPARPYNTWLSIVWVRAFIEPDLFNNTVLFDNTTPIYLINLLWKLRLGLGIDLELHYFSIFRRE